MINELLFATQNAHKAAEIEKLLSGKLRILSLKDKGYTEELPETGFTLEANALQKARFVSENIMPNCFADDTGLEVEVLDGAPGVYSARYAGEDRSDTNNISLLLQNMDGKTNRKARFRTVIALIFEGKEYLFEGMVAGTIIEERRGNNGFGYDPVFVPDGKQITFAEMELSEKNTISHRARAFQQMKEALLKL